MARLLLLGDLASPYDLHQLKRGHEQFCNVLQYYQEDLSWLCCQTHTNYVTKRVSTLIEDETIIP